MFADPDETKNEDALEGNKSLDADKGAQGMWDNIEEREGWRHSVMEVSTYFINKFAGFTCGTRNAVS